MPELPQPVRLALADERTLHIEWSDGRTLAYTIRALREACPCATCREKRAAPQPPPAPLQLTVLSPAEAQPLRLVEMQPVGNYAYGLRFSDGHATGIYTLEMLRAMGREVGGGAPSAG